MFDLCYKGIAVLGAGLILAACAAPEREAREASSKTVVLFAGIQDLQAEVKQLRNQVEVQRHELETLRQRQRRLYDDIDRRLRGRERQGFPQPPSSLMGGVTTEKPVPPRLPKPAPPVVVEANEQEAYEAAFGLLKQSRYGEAIKAFRVFLDKYAHGSLAGNAQYWIAEAHYVTRDFETALDEFHKVVNDYPDSQKVPDALLKIGYAYFELGKRDEARRVLKELMGRYPGTRFAISAQSRLKKEEQ